MQIELTADEVGALYEQAYNRAQDYAEYVADCTDEEELAELQEELDFWTVIKQKLEG